jgi:fatty-acid desaturase
MFEFIAIFLISYVWHALGITIGFHRLLSHRSFACSKLVEYFWVLPGYLAFEGSPIWWTTMHRAHHRFVDTELDPHSPRNGLFYSHTGWLLKSRYPAHIDPAVLTPDLMKDPIYKFLEQDGNLVRSHAMGFSAGYLFRVLILIKFGWIPALASLLAGMAVQQIPIMLNVVCHLPRFGYKNFATEDDGVNVWWVGLLAMGEGWHNNHHTFQGSARTGMRPWEIDVSWWIISFMRRVGLVWRVNEKTMQDKAAIALRTNKVEPAKETLTALDIRERLLSEKLRLEALADLTRTTTHA